MRRAVGLVLAGLGTCLIVFAVLMPTWVSSKVLKFPLNEYASVILTDQNVTYFSPAKLTELTGVNMEATYTIKGNAAAGSSSTAVWNQFIYVYDQTNKLPFQTMTRTFAFDRRTALLINCCGANVNGDSSIEQRGYVGYVLPDRHPAADLRRLRHQPEQAGALRLHRRRPTSTASTRTNSPRTSLPRRTAPRPSPGPLVGQSAASVTLPQYYENHVTYWIDPDTGALLNVTQNERLTLRNSNGATALVALRRQPGGDARPASTAWWRSTTASAARCPLVTTLLPLVTGILGVHPADRRHPARPQAE